MQESMYSALFGALSNEVRLNISANNLANVNTTGYKRDQVSFQDTFLRFAHDYAPDPRDSIRSEKLLPRADLIAKPRLAQQTIDFSQGAVQTTGNPFDLAIQGPGFFKVRTSDGDFYTRNGSFLRSSDGTLVTQQGFQVLGGGGPVDVPDGKVVSIDSSGQVSVDGAPVGEIDVVTIENQDVLKKFGDGLYRGDAAGQAVEGALDEEETRVLQGYLERPNVEVVVEMVNMIETQRVYEAYQKTMTTTNEMDSKIIKTGTER